MLETFTKPQHLSSLVAVLIAAALVAFKHRSAARVAVVVAWIEIAAFTFFHVIPVEVGPSKPYWGDGMGDALQWVGLLSILAVSAAIVRVARRSTERGRHTGRREPAVMIEAEALIARSGYSRGHRPDSVISLEPATAAGSCRFFSLALCGGAAVKQDDLDGRSVPCVGPARWTEMRSQPFVSGLRPPLASLAVLRLVASVPERS